MSIALGILRRFLPHIAGVLAIIGIVLWVRGMQHDLREAKVTVDYLSSALKTEQAARKADIAGLTALAKALASAATDTRRDEAILKETIGASSARPASPELRAFLLCLGAADRGDACATPGPGRTTPTPAGNR